MVFRTYGGRTIVSRRPLKSRVRPSREQREQRNRFRSATAYAKSIVLDPVKSAFYARLAAAEKMRVFALAIRDFFRPPSVDEIDLTGYRGRVGDVIGVFASDDSGVARVEVQIKDMAGRIVESGSARLATADWVYPVRVNAPAGYPLMIVATAYDHPGNIGTKDVPWVPLRFVSPSKSTVRT